MNIKKKNKKIVLLGIASVVMVFALMLLSPDYAHAANTLNFSAAINSVKHIATAFLLPIAIVVCGWRIIYIAVFGGLIGADPLHIITSMDQSDEISAQEVKVSILAHLAGFFKGLLWVGGIWIVFQLATTLAAYLATIFTSSF